VVNDDTLTRYMLKAFLDAFWDSLAALPWLLTIYVLFELLERRYEGGLKKVVASSKPMGPLVGALLGCIPQCGFSAVASALYCHRSISLGTLLSVYLSTSDEAVPVILAQPQKIGVLAPLLLSKVIIAMLAGFIVDAVVTTRKRSALSIAHNSDCACVEETHCCGHSHDKSKPLWIALIIFPVRHALQIFLFILAVSFCLNFAMYKVGENALSGLLLGGSVFQPLLTVLIGLIPNCAASVVITQMFLQNAISFGSAVAGLCSSAGLGLIVLFKEIPTVKEAIKITALLAGISLLSGIILNLLF